MRKIAWWEWLAVAALVAVALGLRTRDLALYKLSPDDGQYMNSARLQTLERSTDAARWVREDLEWLGELRDDWGRSTQTATTYQHSYLHQFLFRYGYRLGLGRVEALRTNSAVLGALTVLALWAIHAWLFPGDRRRRAVGLVAAAITSVSLVHVFQSRTGWGQIGTTFFFVLYFALGWRVLAATDERDTRRLVRLGLAMTLVSVLAMGFQEMTSVLVVAMCAMALLAPWWRDGSMRGWGSFVLRSRALRVVLLSAIPVGAYTLCLRLYSDYAREKWFKLELYANLSWWDLRVAAVRKFFVIDHVPAQLSIPVLLLAIVGMRAAWKERRAWFRYAFAWLVLSSVVFFLVFNDPTLLRVYLPTMVVTIVFAAEGLVWLARALAGRVAAGRERLAALGTALATVGLCAWLGAVTWTSVFGDERSPLFEPGVYAGIPSPRRADTPWIEYLEDHRVTAELGVWPAKDPLFVALDAGFRGRLFSFDEGQATWTEYLLGVQREMGRLGYRVEDGGRYRLVVADRSGRIGLYALEGRAQ